MTDGYLFLLRNMARNLPLQEGFCFQGLASWTGSNAEAQGNMSGRVFCLGHCVVDSTSRELTASRYGKVGCEDDPCSSQIQLGETESRFQSSFENCCD